MVSNSSFSQSEIFFNYYFMSSGEIAPAVWNESDFDIFDFLDFLDVLLILSKFKDFTGYCFYSNSYSVGFNCFLSVSERIEPRDN